MPYLNLFFDKKDLFINIDPSIYGNGIRWVINDNYDSECFTYHIFMDGALMIAQNYRRKSNISYVISLKDVDPDAEYEITVETCDEKLFTSNKVIYRNLKESNDYYQNLNESLEFSEAYENENLANESLRKNSSKSTWKVWTFILCFAIFIGIIITVCYIYWNDILTLLRQMLPSKDFKD
ncbi:MAG: hypothetical protein MHPSP_004327, partial [Paramarteilia canceri]